MRAIVLQALAHDRVFEAVERGIIAHRDQPCHSLDELRRTRSTKAVGDLWEHVCVAVLRVRYADEFQRVSLLRDLTDDDLSALGLRRADRGIDALAWFHDGGVAAIQCKFRADTRRPVPWRDLSTFYALVARTGPFRKHVVMTNVKSVRREGRRTAA